MLKLHLQNNFDYANKEKLVSSRLNLRVFFFLIKTGIVRNGILCLLTGLLFAFSFAENETPNPEEIPLSVKLPIFLKVLSFDRRLKERSGEDLNVLVVYQSGYNYSQLERDDAEDIFDNLSITSIEGMSINYYYLNLDEANLRNEIVRNKINIIFVCPLRGISLRTIASICRERNILSFVDLASYVENDFSVGVEMKGGKSQIVINLRNAKAEGVDFSSQLLKLARIIE